MANGSIKNCEVSKKARYISIRFDIDVFEALNEMAKKDMTSFSLTVNNLVKKTLKGNICDR